MTKKEPMIFKFIIASVLWLSVPLSLFAETVVIVHPSNSLNALSKDDVRSIFLGNLYTFPNTTSAARPVNQLEGSAIRNSFYLVVAGKSPRKMNSYWARYLFTGKGRQPEVIGDDLQVVNYVANTEDAIGYVAAETVTDNVKIVYRLP